MATARNLLPETETAEQSPSPTNAPDCDKSAFRHQWRRPISVVWQFTDSSAAIQLVFAANPPAESPTLARFFNNCRLFLPDKEPAPDSSSCQWQRELHCFGKEAVGGSAGDVLSGTPAVQR